MMQDNNKDVSQIIDETQSMGYSRYKNSYRYNDVKLKRRFLYKILIIVAIVMCILAVVKMCLQKNLDDYIRENENKNSFDNGATSDEMSFLQD